MRKSKFSIGDTVKYSRKFVANHPQGEELKSQIGTIDSVADERSRQTPNGITACFEYVNVLWSGQIELESVYAAKLQKIKDKDSVWLYANSDKVNRLIRHGNEWNNPGFTPQQIKQAMLKFETGHRFTVSAKHFESVVRGASTLGGPINVSVNGSLVVESGTVDTGEYSAKLCNGEEWGIGRRKGKNIVTFAHSGEDVEFKISPINMLAALQGMAGIVECTVTDKTLLIANETRAAVTRLY